VIVITGPGRSGTSALALLYKELGFDPGGNWIDGVNAGLEHGEFWRLNNALAKAVGVTMPRKARAVEPVEPTEPAEPAEAAPTVSPAPRFIAGIRRRGEESRGTPPKPVEPAPEPKPTGVRARMTNWDRYPAALEEFGPTMVRLAQETPVVKDPRFVWTLPLWLGAGAPIEHVVITTRSIEDMIASRHAAGLSGFDANELRNTLTYGLGLITAAVMDGDVSHSFVRFPDFLHDVDGLYAALRFPRPISLERFRATSRRVLDVAQVNDYSADDAAS
jgi:hypothetical protein